MAPSQERWDRGVRLWWLHLAAAVGMSLSLGISLVLVGRWYLGAYLLFVLAFAFQGGMFYGERLRQLGVPGRLAPRPADDAGARPAD